MNYTPIMTEMTKIGHLRSRIFGISQTCLFYFCGGSNGFAELAAGLIPTNFQVSTGKSFRLLKSGFEFFLPSSIAQFAIAYKTVFKAKPEAVRLYVT